MNNPFSNRVCVDSSDYILKKKRLAKIEHLKSSKYANYKTSTYHVTSNNYKPTMLKKGIYPQEPKFVPNPMMLINELRKFLPVTSFWLFHSFLCTSKVTMLIF